VAGTAAARPHRDAGVSGDVSIRDLWESVEETALRRGSAVERLEYWKGYLDAYLSRTPIRYPPAEPSIPAEVDRLDPLRPLIGHGPDLSADVFQQRFPAGLAARRETGATADRAHNEIWDRLVEGGVLGLVAFVWLAVRILQHALSACGYAMDRKRRQRFTRVAVGAAVLLGSLTVVWPGPFFFGVGFQVGLALGLLIYLALGPLRAGRGGPPRLEEWGLLAALIAHLVELTVGFGIAATRLTFWLAAGLLVAASVRPRRAASQERSAATRTGAGLLLGLALGGFAFAALGTQPFGRPVGETEWVYTVLGESGPFGFLFGAAGEPPATALLLVSLLAVPWIWYVVTPTAFADNGSTGRSIASRAGPALVGPAVLGAALLGIAAHHRMLAADPVRLEGLHVVELTDRVLAHAAAEADRIALFFVWSGAVWLLLACLLSRGPTRRRRGARTRVAGAAAFGVALVLIWLWGVRPLRADHLNRVGMRWRTGEAAALSASGREPISALRVSTALLLRSAENQPGCAEHWFNVAEAASALALVVPDAEPTTTERSPQQVVTLGRTELFTFAVESLGKARAAQRASPLVPLNLYYVHGRWARADRDPSIRERQRQLAAVWLEQAERIFGPGRRLDESVRRERGERR
jgi:hypothetical protein